MSARRWAAPAAFAVAVAYVALRGDWALGAIVLLSGLVMAGGAWMWGRPRTADAEALRHLWRQWTGEVRLAYRDGAAGDVALSADRTMEAAIRRLGELRAQARDTPSRAAFDALRRALVGHRLVAASYHGAAGEGSEVIAERAKAFKESAARLEATYASTYEAVNAR